MAAISDAVLNFALHWNHSGLVTDAQVVDFATGTIQRVSQKRLPPLRDDAFRIVCISDTHDAHRCIAVPPAHVLLHAGDIQMTSRKFSVADCAAKIDDFNRWLGSLGAHHKIVIGGNHDRHLESMGADAAKKALSNATFLVFEDTVISHPTNPDLKLHVYGAPFSNGDSGNKAYQLRTVAEAQVSEGRRRLPVSAVPAASHSQVTPSPLPLYDIALTHEPYCTHVRLSGGHQRLGSISVGGHLHAHYGIRRHKDVHCVVACSVSQKYAPVNPPIVFDWIPSTTVASTLHEHAIPDSQ